MSKHQTVKLLILHELMEACRFLRLCT